MELITLYYCTYYLYFGDTDEYKICQYTEFQSSKGVLHIFKMFSRGFNFQQIQKHTLGYTDLSFFLSSYLRKKISQSSRLDGILGIQGFAFSVLESDSLLMEHFSSITPLIIMQDVMEEPFRCNGQVPICLHSTHLSGGRFHRTESRWVTGIKRAPHMWPVTQSELDRPSVRDTYDQGQIV